MMVYLVILIGAGLLPTLILRAMGLENGFWLIANLWRGEGGGDSWGAITKALQYLDTHGADQFYEMVYYNSGHQFIYSPLSLIFYRVTQFPPLIDWYSQDRMNSVSWWVMLAMILVMTLTMRKTIMKYGRSNAAPTVIQMIGLTLLAIIAVSAFAPINSAIRHGQIQTWLDLLAMLSLFLLIIDRRLASGIVIGLAAIVKPQLGVMLAWAALRRDWRFLAGGLIPIVVFGTASLMDYGWKIHSDYLSLLLFLSGRGESYIGNQSINGLLNRMFFLGPNVTFEPTHSHMIYSGWVHAATSISSAAMVLAALLIRSPRNTLAGTLDFCTALLVCTVASPIAYGHHYGLILPVWWLALLSIRSSEQPNVRLYGLLALSYLPLANDMDASMVFADSHWNFLESTPLFGALLLLFLLYRLRLGSERFAVFAAA
jgi:hypothetical protein